MRPCERLAAVASTWRRITQSCSRPASSPDLRNLTQMINRLTRVPCHALKGILASDPVILPASTSCPSATSHITPPHRQRTCSHALIQSYAHPDMCCLQTRRPADTSIGFLPRAARLAKSTLILDMPKMSSSRKRRHRPTPTWVLPFPWAPSQPCDHSRRPRSRLALPPSSG